MEILERVPVSASGAPIRRLLMWAALAVPLAGGLCEEARAGCREVAKPLVEAVAARDLDAARRHYDAVHGEFDCPDTYRARAGRTVSDLHAEVARERLAGGASLASQRTLLEQGLTYGRTWRTLFLLGEVAHGARDYDHAAQRYQEALVAINDETVTPQLPPDAVIDRIVRLAGQSRMLARGYVATPTNRADEPDGLAASKIRGFKVEEVPLPITFETGSAEFDAQGRRYAEETAQTMIRQAPDRVTISAHTDERGTDAYNLELSRRRGEAVRRFLQARGVTQPIEVIAKGESQPLELLEPEHYGQEEVWRMNRRVQWIR